MNRRRWVWLIVGMTVVMGLAACFVWLAASDYGSAGRMALYQEDDGKSDDLATDIKRMWATRPLTGDAGPAAGPNPKGSTPEATSAASRVFNTVNLTGKTRDEVIALLGDPQKSNDSVYNFPFSGAPQGCLVYRFDTSMGGWQFNVLFDWNGRVSEVQRYGIE